MPEPHMPEGPGRPPFRLKLRRLAAALVIGALIGAVVAVVVGSRQQTYESRAVLAIDQPLAIAASGNGGVVEKLSRLRGKYAGLVRTNVIAQPVATRVGIGVGVVRGSLSATADDTSLLLTVRARATSAASARTLAAAAAEEVVRYAADEQTRYAIPEPQQFAFEIVVPAGAGAPVTSQRSRQVKVGFVGLVVGAALAFGALELFDTERRR